MNINPNIFVPFGQPTAVSYFPMVAEQARTLESELASRESTTMTIEPKPESIRRFGRRAAFAEAK